MRLLGFLVLLVLCINRKIIGEVSRQNWKEIKKINKKGPFIGIVAPNTFEMNPLLQSSSFHADPKSPFFDFAGRRFRIGKLKKKRVIIVMSGLSMLNAGFATQLLVTLFKVKGVVHHGIAGNANPQLQIGDVTIPQFWAHSGLWNWQRFGQGGEDELALEVNGDYTRKFGHLNFSTFNNHKKLVANLFNSVWYQPEEVFPINSIPEVRQHAFWVPVDNKYFKVAKKLKNVKLEGCVNKTCLPRNPEVVRVKRGISSNMFVDNKAYRQFLSSKFDATPIDMESAAVALTCLQYQTPFIAIRALSDLAGDDSSSLSNEASLFASLASQNAVTVLIKFISLLPS